MTAEPTLIQIDRDAIVRVYTGKPGCGCGCKGRYFEDARNITRVVKLMNARANEIVAHDSTDYGKAGNNPRTTTFAVEGETRFLWAFTG